MVSEDQLIERVRRLVVSPAARQLRGTRLNPNGLRTGIGDDAAVLRPGAGSEWVVTTDAFLENVHFLRKTHPPKAVGYKSLARATSDIAAMGARARYFFMTVGLPDACAGTWLDDFLGGMAGAARRFGLILAGGDTTKYPLVVASFTVVGEADRGRAILRSGARPGDLLCVSGRLGEAELGFRLLQRKPHKHKHWSRPLKKHFYPEPRLALGEWLASHRRATSMIDT
jgi:thiamine-monophosphate kinase